MTRFILVLSSILIGYFVSGSVDATQVLRQNIQNASGFCQSALPAYEGLIRKRPLAIANEGTSTAFVSCSLSTHAEGSGIPRTMLFLTNANSSSVQVACTLVSGYAKVTNPSYLPKVVTLPPDNFGVIEWLAGADNAGVPFEFLNLSCALPPGVEIGYAYFQTLEDVGA